MIQGGILHFGNFKWQVLDIKDGKTLIITEEIIDLRWYHQEFAEITWADCSIRAYLDNEFYKLFSQEEKARIIPTLNSNSDNPWFKTKGGIDTPDRIFLLSLEEVCKHFGDSRENLKNKGSQKWYIADENNTYLMFMNSG